MYIEIKKCRICQSDDLLNVFRWAINLSQDIFLHLKMKILKKVLLIWFFVRIVGYYSCYNGLRLIEDVWNELWI